ncbi:MAG: hypothetical protein E7Z63_01020 [Thermoplasmata archaeon]|nr:hypothetical protein [Thermoplasmata archaeon]
MDATCIRDTIKGNVYYGVYDNGKTVFALVVLIQTDPNIVYLKFMDETMGPPCYDMPVSYLDLLSPTTNELALEWRRTVRDFAPVRKGGFDERRYSVEGGPDVGYDEMLQAVQLPHYSDSFRRAKMVREQRVGDSLLFGGVEVTRTRSVKGKRRW